MKGTQILMHANTPVAECSFGAEGYLKDIPRIINAAHLPPSVDLDDEECNAKLALQRWILSRSLSSSRTDVAPLREFYGNAAFTSATGASLFDSYWFSDSEHKDWEACNPYDHWDAGSDSLYLMLHNPAALETINACSPNLTIPGKKKRLWYRYADSPVLLHGNAQAEMNAYKQANGSKIVAKRVYALLREHLYAVQQVETSKEIEMIPFEEFYLAGSSPSRSKIDNIRDTCAKFGITGWKEFFTEMIDFDERTQNTSRELTDVGVLRNVSTLEIVGFAKL